MINARALVPTHNIFFATFDSLRYDVAMEGIRKHRTPNLTLHLPGRTWEQRQTPGSFTFAAHQAFFSGFLPTPTQPGRHPRLFAAKFPGSESTTPETFVFEEPTLPEALAKRGYRTFCIGGVGFFNKQTPLGSVLPNRFEHSFWWPYTGPANPNSQREQVNKALNILRELPKEERVFLFINFSATHRPTHIYVKGAKQDSFETQLEALAAIDHELPRLFEALRQHGPTLVIMCADHGEAFGEDGYWGHRVNHPVVLTVPYAEWVME